MNFKAGYMNVKPPSQGISLSFCGESVRICVPAFLPESRLKLVFRHIQGVLSYIQQFEASFVKKEMEKANAERK